MNARQREGVIYSVVGLFLTYALIIFILEHDYAMVALAMFAFTLVLMRVGELKQT